MGYWGLNSGWPKAKQITYPLTPILQIPYSTHSSSSKANGSHFYSDRIYSVSENQVMRY